MHALGTEETKIGGKRVGREWLNLDRREEKGNQ